MNYSVLGTFLFYVKICTKLYKHEHFPDRQDETGAILPWQYWRDTPKDQLQHFCVLHITYPKAEFPSICRLR